MLCQCFQMGEGGCWDWGVCVEGGEGKGLPEINLVLLIV